MAHYMCQAAEQGELTYEERRLLGSAFQQAVSRRREAWRKIVYVEKSEEVNGNEHLKSLTEEMRTKVEKEVQDLCDELLQLLETNLLPKSLTTGGEASAFFLKLKGDFFRYVAEFATGPEKRKALDSAQEAYLKGTEMSRDYLLVTHPTRLGLTLNFAIFTAAVLEDKDRALEIAAEAYEAAVSELDNISEEAYAACTLTLRLIKDQIDEWSGQQNA